MFLFNRFSHINYYATLVVGLMLISPWGLAEENAGHETDSEADHRIIKSHYFAAQGESKYPSDFKHFDYVNPDAPKGGTLKLATVGTYDNFNRYATRGNPAIRTGELFDSLMIPSLDEIDVYYPLIAEAIEYPENYAWVIFHINPRAQDHSGKAITAEDVAFSFNKFMSQGVPQFRSFFKNVDGAEVLDKHRVRFNLKQPNRDDLVGLLSLSVFPRHDWEERDLSEPLSSPPVGTGPYRVGEYKMGQSITYERVRDYWASDLPSRKGTMNFNQLRYDYYRDTTVALEAFKAGEYDFRSENSAKHWAEDYDVAAVRRGSIVREELAHSEPQPMSALVFNVQHELFKDRRVRHALNYALDFEWLNQNLFYKQYERNHSYFQNTPYMAEGNASEAEREILEPYKDQIPEEVLQEEVWRPNVTDGSGNIRPALRNAMSLLKEAGWELQNGKMVNAETGKPFSFEVIYYSPTSERYLLPFKRNLERLGIQMNPRQLDTSQFLNRLRNRDFAMIDQGYRANAYPNSTLPIAWHSDYLDSTYNQAGVVDPVIDALMEGIVANQQNPDKLMAYGKAFDRLALWSFYVIPQWHSSNYRIAHWDQFSRPDTRPDYDLGLDTWWYDADKAGKLRR